MRVNIYSVIAVLGLLTVLGCAQTIDRIDSVISSFGDDQPQASATARKDGYGAIAFSQTTLRWHMRWNVISADRASVVAIEQCGAADCRVVLLFGPKQCGTFSLGKQNALAVGRGFTSAIAHDAALNGCVASGQICKVAPVQCND